MASAGNMFYEELRGLAAAKRTVTATCTARVGTPANGFRVDKVLDVDDPAANVTITIPDGLEIGQTVMIVTSSNSESKTITASVTHHTTSDPEAGTLSTVDQYVLLMWTGTEWVTIAGDWST